MEPCDPTSALPETFPAVSMSVELGSVLQRYGKTLDIDLAALNDVMTGEGVARNVLQDVELHIGFKGARSYTGGHAGVGMNDSGGVIHKANVRVSESQVSSGDTTTTERKLTHESKHVADHQHTLRRYIEERRAVRLLGMVAGRMATSKAACYVYGGVVGGLLGHRHGGDSGSALLQKLEPYQMGPEWPVQDWIASHPSAPLVITGVALGVAVGELVGHGLYRLRRTERRAREAERHHDRYPKVISISSAA